MLNDTTLSLYGPIVIMVIALIWAGGRVMYLSLRENVSVLAFMARKKTYAELSAGVTALILDGYLLLRPFIADLDQRVYAFGPSYPRFGIFLMASSILLMILSQLDMGRSWRIGIPAKKEESQSLITSGLYAYSRNPIYVAIMLFIMGAAVLVPGPITIGSFVVTFMLLQRIIEREEAFMAASFGKDYEAYCHEVRRWL